MGERKVLNKYFPPDFDPKKVPRMKRDLEKQIGVRMMIPFSLQCNTCGEFMYRGKKFNSLKEDCIGEDYLGIRRFRFYIKCVICSQEITFKTDPEKGDYELETGASRNFESWTDKQATEDEHKKAREEEEKSDNMKQLENRTLDSKIELEIMDALDEIKAVNRRHESVDTANVLKASAARREKGASDMTQAGGNAELDEDDALIANINFGGSKVIRLAGSGSDDSDGADSADPEEVNTVGASAQGKEGVKRANGKGERGDEGAAKGKGKMRAVGSSSQGAPQFRSARKPSAGPSALSGAEGASGGEEGGGGGGGGGDRAEEGGAGADAAASGSMLLSAIEAQARREAEKAKLAAGATVAVVVKRKKKKSSSKDKEKGKGSAAAGGAGGGGGKGVEEASNKKRKKHKHQHQLQENGGGGGGGGQKKGGSGGVAGGKGGVGVPAKKTDNGGGSVPAATEGAGVSPAAGAGASTLGGLNLLGSYDSSSSSDDASR